MTATTVLQEKLAATLSTLETALLSPPVAGELSTWANAVREAAATLAVDLTAYLRSVLQVQYAEIARADPELAAHVEKLQRGDQELMDQLARFHEELYNLSEAACAGLKDELKLAGQRQKLEDDGIGLILGIRRQQAAATTWLTEAHFRDRGVAAD